jgi:hypothetical protein
MFVPDDLHVGVRYWGCMVEHMKGDLMRKMILAAVVGVMLIGGAAVAVAQTEDGSESPDGRVGSFISDVLDGLVSDGTLTDEQAAAVEDAFEAAHEERIAEREARRDEMQAARDQIRVALEDGVITAEELAELPEGPWSDADGPLAEALEDGQITQEELDELRPFGHRGHGSRGEFGHGFGPGPDASDAATSDA